MASFLDVTRNYTTSIDENKAFMLLKNQKERREPMAKKKIDCDWRLFEFSLEELGIDTEGSSYELEREGCAVLSEQNDKIRGNYL